MAQEPVELIVFRQAAEAIGTPVILFDARGERVYSNEAAAAGGADTFRAFRHSATLPLRGPDGTTVGSVQFFWDAP